MLAAELAFVHAAGAQASPREGFWIRDVLAEFAGELDEGEAFAGNFMANFFQAREHGEITSYGARGRQGGFGPPLTQPLPEGEHGAMNAFVGERGMRFGSDSLSNGASALPLSPPHAAMLHDNLRGEAG